MLFFTIVGIFATFLLCAGASLVGITMSYARPYKYSSWDNNPTPKTSIVLVAREDMSAGTKISIPEAKFRVRLYRIGEEPRDAASDFNQVGGMVLTRDLRRGEVCTLAHLQNPLLRIALPEGKKTFSFRTTLPPEIAGFVAPGTRVDVSGQAPFDPSGQGGGFRVLAPDVLVLAVNLVRFGPEDPEIVQPALNVEPGKLVVLTVAITPDEAVALTGAMRQGQLTVTLRAPKD